jgi:hypothetical protein
MDTPTAKALAANQAHLKRRIDAQARQIRRLQELAHTLAQAHERMRLELDLAMGRGEPETAYERCARQQANSRVEDYARRLLVHPVPSPQEAS